MNKKHFHTLTTLLFIIATFQSLFAQPCSSITTINCGTSSSITLSGAGVWNSACGILSGQEKIYSFTPLTTGVYSIQVTTANGSIDYMYKAASGGCVSMGWTCIGVASSVGTFNTGTFTAGVEYYIRLDASSTASATHSFHINCLSSGPANDNCANATTLTPGPYCSGAVSGTTVGATQSIPAISCSNTGTADDDVWYKFVATSTNHTIFCFSEFDAVVDVRTGACNGTNIECVEVASSDYENLDLTGLTVDATYYIRVYSFGGNASDQGTFSICVKNLDSPCSSILPLSCGISTAVTSFGPGVWNNGICGLIGEGQETIFSFTPQVPGFYTLIVTDRILGSEAMNYMYKAASGGCGSNGWTCIAYLAGVGGYFIGQLAAGVEYYILVDGAAENYFSSQNFQIDCLVDPCFNIASLSCGTPVTTSLSLPGAWNNNTCGSSTPGNEKIYSFTPQFSGVHYIEVTNADGVNNYIDYMYKAASGGCNSAGWACMDRFSSPGGRLFGPLTAGVQYYILLDAETTSPVTQTFRINCPASGITNDNCFLSAPLTSATSCIPTPGSTIGATSSSGLTDICTSSSGSDVWYHFVATATEQTVTVLGSTGFNAVIEVSSGLCGAPVIGCVNATTTGAETLALTGLTVGATYYIRVYSLLSDGTFTICLTTQFDPCTGVVPLPCSTPTTVTLSGSGIWNNATCGISTSGKEKYYSFTPVITGPHYLEVNSATGTGYIDYQYKLASEGCSSTGWTCIGAVNDATILEIGVLTAGVEYYILLDAEGIIPSTQIFQISCLPPVPLCLAAPFSPANSATVCQNVTLSWPSVELASGYDVYFGTSFTPPFVTNVSGTTYNAGTLAGGTYYWQIRPKNVAGTAAGCPVWSFTVNDPVGKTLSNPLIIGSFPYTHSGNNLAANCWIDSYIGANNQPSPDVFYRFTNTVCQNDVTISLCGSSFDTYLHLLNSSGVEIASNDNNGPMCPGTSSSIQTSLPAGTYYIVVEGAGSSTGNYNLSFLATDNIPPMISCPSNIELCGSQAVTYTTPTATDNCSVIVTQTAGLASGAIFPVGTTTNTFQAADPAGNIVSCSFDVIISIPVAMATPSSQTICSGSAITAIDLTGSMPGTTFDWTRDNTATVTGIVSNGTGNITGTLVNTTNALVTVTFTITPSVGACVGLPVTATVLVNPIPTVNVVSNLVVCNNTSSGAVTVSGAVTGTVYNWTNNTTSIGLAASGSGNISSFTATNATSTPVIATITVTPTYTNAGITCTGTATTFTITVNPTPSVNAVSNQTVCNGSGTTGITFSGTPASAVFNWTNNNPSIGLAANGTGDIASLTAVNTGTTPLVATITVTPGYTNAGTTCTGTPITFTITVNPTPDASTSPGSQTICSGTSITGITTTGSVTGTVYNWVRNNTGSVTGIAASGTGNISGTLTNTTNAAVMVSFTITPSYTNAGTTCTSASITATVTVNPAPDVTQPANQVICNNGMTAPVNFTGSVAGTTFNWTNNTTSIGLAANGSGNISSFTGTNATNAPVTSTITVTPSIGGAGFAYIPNFISGDITIINTTTDQATTIAFPGSNPIGAAVSNDGTRAYIGNQNGNIAIINTATNTIIGTTPYIGSAPYALAVSPDGKKVYSANQSAAPDNVGIFNTQTNIVEAAASAGNISRGIAITPNGSFVYVANAFSDDVSVINTLTKANIATIPVGDLPSEAAVSPDGSRVYIANNLSNDVSVINTLTNTVIATFGTGAFPSGLALNPSGTRLYVVNQNSNDVGVYNTATNAFITSIPVGSSPRGIAITSEGTKGYVANGNSNNVSVFNTTTNTVITTVAAGNIPWGAGGGKFISPPLPLCTGTPKTFTITVNPTAIINSVANQTLCNNTLTTAINFSSPTTGGSIVYNWTNTNAAIGLASSGSGNIPAFTATNVTTSPISGTITVTPAYTNGGTTCNGTPITFTINVNPTNTITLTSVAGTDNQTVLINTPITNITYATTSATGATFSGLPTGVTANWAGNVATISGTPSVGPGVFNYTITLTGGCGNIIATGTINVIVCSITRTSAVGTDNQVLCNNTAITNITYSTTGATGATFSGLPTGVTGSWAANVVTISGTPSVPGTFNYTVTPTGGGCSGMITATGIITVNPIPTVNAVANQVICNGSSTAAVNFSGTPAGVVYNWTNNTPSIGLASSGTGNIAVFTATNATNAPVTATVTVTPTFTNLGVTCTGSPITFTYTVNPTPTVNAVSNQVLCNNTSTTAIAFTGFAPGTVYNWTNNTPSIGLAGSGTGNLASFTATNETSAAVTATITVTPTYTNAGVTCTGNSITFTITVNPTPTANAITNQVLCNNASTTAVNFTGFVPGTVYNWTNNTPSIGLASSGTGNIASFTATNVTSAPVVATFTVTLTFTNGGTTCTGTPVTFTITVNPTPNADATPSAQTICSAGSITTIVLTGAVIGTTYAWTRDNTASVTGIAASGSGNISGVLTNTTTAPVTVTFTITPTANSCGGPAITATVIVNPTPNAVATPSSQTICSASSITTIVLTGAVSGTTYAWTRDNTVAVTGIAASGSGNISGALTNTTTAPVTVTFTIIPTANGCPGPAITATVLVNPTPNAVATPASQTICSAASISTIVLTGAVSGTTYNWTRDNNASVTGITASGSGDISGLLTNTTTAPVTVTFTIIPTANGCPGPAITATVLVNPTPNAVATPASQTICSAASISTIVLTGAVTGTTYNWTRDNTATVTGIAASGSGNIPGTLTNTTAAPVTVTFTIIPTANGCPGAPITATVLVNPTPNAVATPASQTICSAAAISTIVLTGAVTGTTYAWTRNNTATVTGIAASGSGNILGTLTNTTTAPVTVTFTITPTANGCGGPAITATVLVNPTPNAVATPASQTICSAAAISTIVLTGAVTGTTYGWTRNNTANVTGIAASGSGNISGTLTNTTAAPVTVTFTITPTANGCPGPSITATVLVNPTPNAIATPASQGICTGSNIIPIILTGAVSGTTYAWTRNNTATATGIAASGSGNITGGLVNNTASSITVTFTITPTANGCPGPSITATVIVNPNPIGTISIVPNPACVGSTVQLSASGGATYSWAGPLGYTSTLQNPTILLTTYQQGGQYKVTITSGPGCSVVKSATLTVNYPPVITASYDQNTACTGSTLRLHGTGGGSYTWSGPSGFTSNKKDPEIQNATAANSGIYTLTVTSPNGCTATTTLNITINTPPVVNANPTLTQTCEGSTVQLSATGTGSFSWSGPAGWVSINQNPVINNIPVYLSGTYTVTLTANTGCTSTASVAIKVYDQIYAVATADPNPVCEGQSLQLHGEGGSGYLWTGPNGFNSNESDPRIDNISKAHAGSYYVFVTNEGGCSGYAEVKVEVLPSTKATASATPNPVAEFSSVQFTCSDGLSYSWTGPLNFTSNQQNPGIKKVTRYMAGIYIVTIINENGCPSVVKVNLRVTYKNKENSIGAETTDKSEVLETRTEKVPGIYPNPTNDYLYFESESSSAIEYRIYDLSGREHVQLSITTDQSISTSQLSMGVYQIRWKPKDIDTWINSRFIKIR